MVLVNNVVVFNYFQGTGIFLVEKHLRTRPVVQSAPSL
jgi:hypothetical protein